MNANAATGSLLSRTLSHSDVRVPVRAAAVFLAVAATAVSAQFTLPFPGTTVPLVLTPLAVMLTGAVLGSRLGFLSQALYLMAGIIGLPVFAPSITLPPGALRLIGPTGGYLLAYPVAAFVTGWLAERGWDRRYLTSLASLLAGLAVIFVGGVSWLSLLPGQSVGSAIATGFMPFVLIDLVKAAVAAKILPTVWRFAKLR